MDNIWEKIIDKYPDIEKTLDDLYNSQLNLLKAIEKLEKDYPVEGYEWECDPNAIGRDTNPWYPKSIKITERQIKKSDERLKKQLVCVEGKHHFQTIGSLQWCKYCGTVKSGDKLFYPEVPHFLPND